MLTKPPFIVYANKEGHIFEDTSLHAIGRAGKEAMCIELSDWIPLPAGGCLYTLPGRVGLGYDLSNHTIKPCTKGNAVAAFIPPAHTGLFLAAYEKEANAPDLPLFCYTAVGWYEGQFYVAAMRIEADIRQESIGFDDQIISQYIHHFKQEFPHNRIIQHLAEKCCNTYQCPAARNYFMNRWECPIPTSVACNANCLGCISFQPEEHDIVSTQDRLTFTPSVEEIVEYSVAHLQTAPFPIVSFGQGCEGEPLLMTPIIEQAIRQIRQHTSIGCIHMNTNASKPQFIERLAKVGLNSMRVSLNSLQPDIYHAYYKPNNYTFDDVIRSIAIAHQYGLWISLNYFIFPGLTDTEAEYQALVDIVQRYRIDLIQCRNLNIDPDWYISQIPYDDKAPLFGIKQIFSSLQEDCPWVRLGYYNPPIERIRGNWDLDFAH